LTEETQLSFFFIGDRLGRNKNSPGIGGYPERGVNLPFEEKLLESFTRSSNLNYEFLDSVDIPQFNRTRMFKIKCFLSLTFANSKIKKAEI